MKPDGGSEEFESLDSTEILENPGVSWRTLYTARLPSRRNELRAGTVNNVLFIFGNN